MARGTSWGPRLDPLHPEARGTSDSPLGVFSWHRFWIYIPLPHSQSFFWFVFFLSFLIGVRFCPLVVVSYIFWFFPLIYLLAFTIYFLLCYCSVHPPLFILFFSAPGGFQGLFMGWKLVFSLWPSIPTFRNYPLELPSLMHRRTWKKLVNIYFTYTLELNNLWGKMFWTYLVIIS